MKVQKGFAAACIALVFQAYSQSPVEAVRLFENENGPGVKGLAMGNAFTAAADDGSALLWNPAALTILKSSEIAFAGSHLLFRNDAVFAGTRDLDDRGFTGFNAFQLAFKFPTLRGSFVMALGRHQIKDYSDYLYFNGFNPLSNGLAFDLGTEGAPAFHLFDRDVHQTEQVLQTGSLGAWSFGAGLAMSPHLSMGISGHILSGRGGYDLDFHQQDARQVYQEVPADYDRYEMHQSLKSRMIGFGLTLGALLHLSDQFRIGACLDLPRKVQVNETYSSSDLLVFDNGDESAADLGSGEWVYAIHYPGKVSVGAAIDTETLLLAASADYVDWRETCFEVPSGYSLDDDYSSLLAENPSFRSDFRPVLSYGAGCEFRFSGPGVKVRGGYRVVPSPLAGADRSMDRKYITAGLGYDLDRYTSLNVTYVRGFWTRNSEDGYTPGGTTETIETDRVLAGFTLRF
ncbi:outer membrane protein transport protein [bacterium]|nr:outer membrane protein transport protein [bacterium]